MSNRDPRQRFDYQNWLNGQVAERAKASLTARDAAFAENNAGVTRAALVRGLSIIVTQIRRRRRGCCSNLVLRRAPRPHDMKLRQHGRRSWPCWLPDAGNHPPVKTARKGTPHEKSSSPVRAAFFVVLIGAVFPCYIAQRYRL